MESFEQGQMLLIVVLVMVTVLTIALSVAARSITNTRSSEEAATSEQAFSAAEAGIEKSLTSNSAVTGSFSNSAKYSTTIITVGGLSFPLNNGEPVLKDESTDLWLSTYPGYTNQWNGTINFYWGKPTDSCTQSESTNTMAALEIIVFSGSTANPQTKKYFYDPCANRVAANNFTNVFKSSYTISGQTYAYETPTITISTGLFAHITPLYAPSNIAVTNCGCAGGIPAQGTVIQSVGTSSNTQRKIQTYRYYPQLPAELLQYSFFIPK
jgi:hypothetical protein